MKHLSNASTPHQQLATWLGEQIPCWMIKCKLPGFSIAVVHEGAIIYAEGFGAIV